jgi:hypothetical protein
VQPQRITAHIAARGDPALTRPLPAAVQHALAAHVLSYQAGLYLESATEELSQSVPSTPAVFPAGVACVMLYIYPLTEAKSPQWVYETAAPAGLALRDLVRCVVASYRVIYAAEACAVGAEAHAARVGGMSANRGRTNGPFGIWGHDLGDLVLEGFDWAPSADRSGAGALMPSISS